MGLLPQLYEAAIGESSWQDFAALVARAFQSGSTTLQVIENNESRILDATANVIAHLPAYIEYYARRDVWVAAGITRIGLGNVGASKDIVTDREFERSEFYQDWCRKLDVFYVLGSVVPVGEGRMGVLGIHRSRQAGHYQESDKSLVRLFLPHLRCALRVQQQLQQTALVQAASLDVLSRTETAVLVLSRELRVLFASPPAEALLARSATLTIQGGRLSARVASQAARLRAAVEWACDVLHRGGEPGRPLAFDQGTDRAITVLVAPFPRQRTGEPQPGAIVFVRPVVVPRTLRAALQSLFALTSAEARVAEAMVEGRSIAEIARAQRTAPQTVRTQVKAILQKTATHRQAQCVALLLRSVATLGSLSER